MADRTITTIGIVLAGGEATRLPGKPFRRLGGVPLIERVIALAAPQVGRLAISMRGDDAAYRRLGLELIADADGESQGPLAGIAAGLRRAETLGAEFVAFFPCDAPFAPSDLVARLGAAIAPGGVAVPTYAGRTEQAFGLWSVRLAGDLAAALKAGERRLHAAVEMLGATLVPFDDLAEDPFFNVNSEDDLRAAGLRLAARSPRA